MSQNLWDKEKVEDFGFALSGKGEPKRGLRAPFEKADAKS